MESTKKHFKQLNQEKAKPPVQNINITPRKVVLTPSSKKLPLPSDFIRSANRFGTKTFVEAAPVVKSFSLFDNAPRDIETTE